MVRRHQKKQQKKKKQYIFQISRYLKHQSHYYIYISKIFINLSIQPSDFSETHVPIFCYKNVKIHKQKYFNARLQTIFKLPGFASF